MDIVNVTIKDGGVKIPKTQVETCLKALPARRDDKLLSEQG